MNRITLEEVQAAYKETGAIPRRSRMFFQQNRHQIYCCGAGVIAYKDIGNACKLMGRSMSNLLEKYPKQYILGFVQGFDDTDIYYVPAKLLNEEFKAGYEDGLAIGKAIFNEI